MRLINPRCNFTDDCTIGVPFILHSSVLLHPNLRRRGSMDRRAFHMDAGFTRG